MRGLHTSLVIVVAAIVILIVALVVLTIFGVGITSVRTITEANAQCTTLCLATCRTTGSLPPTWGTASMLVNDKLTACSGVVKKSGGSYLLPTDGCIGPCAP